MGIPYYFASLVRKHRDIVKKISNITPDILAIDFNCLIHTYMDDTSPIESIIKALRDLLDVCTAKVTYVAMDGLVPYGKMVQQRYRRFRIGEKAVFDRHQISPETPYMIELAAAVRAAFPNILVSSTSEPGEGEHKILTWLKTLPKPDSVTIYGLDADLILLALAQTHLANDLTLLRESSTFNAKSDGFTTMSIYRLAERLPIPVDEYLRLCILCFGNDFMPSLGMFSLREGGHERALEIFALANCSLKTATGRAKFIEVAASREMAFYREKIVSRDKPEERAIFGDGTFFKERYCSHILDGNTDASPFWKTYHWTVAYFTENVAPDWGWAYPYPDAPLLCMLGPEPNIKWKKATYTTTKQLQFILPSSSLRTAKKRNLFPDEYYNEETDMRIPWMKRYAWESKPRLSLPWNPSVKQTTYESWGYSA